MSETPDALLGMQLSSRLRRRPASGTMPRVLPATKSSAPRGADWPEGFWEWAEEKRAAWVEKFLRDALRKRKEGSL